MNYYFGMISWNMQCWRLFFNNFCTDRQPKLKLGSLKKSQIS
ncbi:hypothetical protein HMPREF0541_02691 [Lacticaseibacillus rhamnosus ATCC 21052]|nr:hypothetical protein HMPREF0541_02691 [Lacticaseibacillus rhamnosus ATCC 21052]